MNLEASSGVRQPSICKFIEKQNGGSGGGEHKVGKLKRSISFSCGHIRTVSICIP
jgi:hypothetical protein